MPRKRSWWPARGRRTHDRTLMPLRLLYIVTHPTTAKHLLRGQLAFMRDHGFEVTVCAGPGSELDVVSSREGVRTIAVPMSRNLRLTEGPRALAELVRVVNRLRPDIVNASTAKAGLLGMLAAAAVGVPARIYLVRGLRLEGTRGPLRRALGAAELMASSCAHRVVCVSESLREAYQAGGYARGHSRPLTVIPSNGIDVSRFGARSVTRDESRRVRASLGIPEHAFVAGFVGRLAFDKGMVDLVEAFERASTRLSGLHLLVVGGAVGVDELAPALLSRLRQPRIHMTGSVEEPAPYYAAMDLLLFPSYREGLPNAPLEAAASELPAVGYRSTGVVDAILHDRTGTIVGQKDIAGLAAAVVQYAESTELRRVHGAAARARVLGEFTNEQVWGRWLELYRELGSTGRTRT